MGGLVRRRHVQTSQARAAVERATVRAVACRARSSRDAVGVLGSRMWLGLCQLVAGIVHESLQRLDFSLHPARQRVATQCKN